MYYLNNHLKFTILHHKDPQSEKSRIVGFEVKPFSVKHTYKGKFNENDVELDTCHPGKMITVTEQMDPQPVQSGTEIIFTYSVTFMVGYCMTVNFDVVSALYSFARMRMTAAVHC